MFVFMPSLKRGARARIPEPHKNDRIYGGAGLLDPTFERELGERRNKESRVCRDSTIVGVASSIERGTKLSILEKHDE